MGMHRLARLSVSAAILAAATAAHAAVDVTRSADANALAAAFVGGSGAGIQVTAATLKAAGTGASGERPGGIYTISTSPDTYGLTKGGIVLSTGDAADLDSGANTTPCIGTNDCLSFNYFQSGTAAQETLLDAVCPGNHRDVTELDLTFNVDSGVTSLQFAVVFASDEYPTFDSSPSTVDCFALIVDGANYAMANGDVFTVANPGFQAQAGTELNGALKANDGVATVARVVLTVPVVSGSTGHHLVLAISDRLDNTIDSAVWLEALGASGPVASSGLFADGFEGNNLACWSAQTGGAAGGSCLSAPALGRVAAPARELPWDHVLPANLRVIPRD